MVRKRLAPLKAKGGSHPFSAKVQRYDGVGTEHPVALFLVIRHLETGKVVADHMWVRSKYLFRANVPKGSVITFTARIRMYSRLEGDPDYNFDHLRNIEIRKTGGDNDVCRLHEVASRAGGLD